MAANLPYVLQGLARITQSGTYSDVYACELDFGLWRGLFHWFRSFVGAATASEGLAHQHSAACR